MLTISSILKSATKGVEKAEAYLGPKVSKIAKNASRIRITLKPEPVAKPKK